MSEMAQKLIDARANLNREAQLLAVIGVMLQIWPKSSYAGLTPVLSPTEERCVWAEIHHILKSEQEDA